MKAVRKRNETSVIGQIGEDLLSWVKSFFAFFYLKIMFHRMTEPEPSKGINNFQLIGTKSYTCMEPTQGQRMRVGRKQEELMEFPFD